MSHDSSPAILVTGANGHVGLGLLTRLAATPGVPPLRAMVRSSRAADAVRALGLDPAPEIVEVDWSDPDGVVRAVDGCDRIVHLVGILKETPQARYVDAHEGSTTTLMHAATKAGARRILYLSIVGSHPDAENACLASKGRAERILLEGVVPATVLRLPMVLGPGELAAHALRARASAGVVALVRGGASLEQPIDSRDVVAAIVAALEKTGRSIALDLGGPESLTQRALVARAAGVLGRRPPRVIPVPRGLAFAAAGLAERLLASPPVTRAMLGVLDHDDDFDPEPACAALGISLTPLDETLRHTLGEPS